MALKSNERHNKKVIVALISNTALKRIKGYNFWKSSFHYKTTISKKIPCLNIQKNLLQSLGLRPRACKQDSKFFKEGEK